MYWEMSTGQKWTTTHTGRGTGAEGRCCVREVAVLRRRNAETGDTLDRVTEMYQTVAYRANQRRRSGARAGRGAGVRANHHTHETASLNETDSEGQKGTGGGQSHTETLLGSEMYWKLPTHTFPSPAGCSRRVSGAGGRRRARSTKIDLNRRHTRPNRKAP